MSQICHPTEVVSMLSVLGERIRTARVRRRWSMEILAERIGVGRRTVARLEKGDPGIAMGVLLTALWALGLWETVDGFADPGADKVGEFLDKQRLPKRVHLPKEKDLDF
ncbi:MAG: helix-turn-helix domain-containing protein [Kiritimatiellae bacterium]|jgi:transcriptional regulator with XRE-family HTH domain|nr:helix-turn-helix domain-containing protein [Kiritimatiellia bacterium]